MPLFHVQSFAPECNGSVYLRRAAGGNVAGRQRHSQHQGRDASAGEKIIRGNADEQAHQHPIHCERGKRTNAYSDAYQDDGLLDYQPQHADWVRTKRHAYADLVFALAGSK